MFISLWRTLIMFLIVSVILRFMGKRQIGELQPSELVTTIMISNIAAIPIENIDMPFINGVASILLLACLEILFSALALKFRKFRLIAVGHSKYIIHEGKIDQKIMQDLRWSIDDLMEQLRITGVFDISDVAFAIVETNGKLSVYQKPQNAPPVIIINDRIVDYKALAYCNLTAEWLDKTLKQNNCTVKDIFLMTCDRSTDYKIIKKEKTT